MKVFVNHVNNSKVYHTSKHIGHLNEVEVPNTDLLDALGLKLCATCRNAVDGFDIIQDTLDTEQLSFITELGQMLLPKRVEIRLYYKPPYRANARQIWHSGTIPSNPDEEAEF